MKRLVQVLVLFALLCPLAFGQAKVDKKGNDKLPMGIPNAQVLRLQRMGPEERAKALATLPPARRAQIEANLARLDAMAPAARDRLIQRFMIFQSLTRPRQVVIREELQHLRQLRPRARPAYLESPEVTARLSPAEIDLLREVAGLQ